MEEDDDKPLIDEKTAHLLEQTEESLRKMERALGPDHAAVGKILDTYARLLRQNNYRVLDAINMEARAKAIRAKHNQQEAESQAKLFDEQTAVAPSNVRATAATVKAIFWTLALIMVVVIGGFVQQSMKTATKGKLTKIQKVKKTTQGKSGSPGESTGATSEPAAAPDTQPAGGEAQKSLEPELSNAQEVKPQGTSMSKEEFDSKSAGVRGEISKLVVHAREYEQAGNVADAEESYKTAISAASQASSDFGQPVASEDLALAFERLAIILESKGDSVQAASMAKSGKGVRAWLAQQTSESAP